MKYSITPYLSLAGKGAEAIKFYCKYLDAKAVFVVTYKDMQKMAPDFICPKDKESYISHAIIVAGGSQILLSDDLIDGSENAQFGNNVSICIQSNKVSTIRHLYDSLISAKGVKIIAPLAATAFSSAYAIVIDPFGFLIQLNVEKAHGERA